MAVAFAQSMRALAADRGRWSLTGLLMVCALLGGWGAWFVGARVAVYEVTPTARLEVDQAVHPIATPVAGRIVATYLVVGRAVQALGRCSPNSMPQRRVCSMKKRASASQP